DELKKMHLKSNTEIEKLKENDNEKNQQIQQLKQCQSAFDIRITKLEELLKKLNETKQNENIILKQQLICFVFYFHFAQTNHSLHNKNQKIIVVFIYATVQGMGKFVFGDGYV
ncbi:hypothetical protein RFI_36538, partial [Reticulomyxa filosa]